MNGVDIPFLGRRPLYIVNGFRTIVARCSRRAPGRSVGYMGHLLADPPIDGSMLHEEIVDHIVSFLAAYLVVCEQGHVMEQSHTRKRRRGHSAFCYKCLLTGDCSFRCNQGCDTYMCSRCFQESERQQGWSVTGWQDLVQCGIACRSWATAASKEHLWKQLYRMHFPLDPGGRRKICCCMIDIANDWEENQMNAGASWQHIFLKRRSEVEIHTRLTEIMHRFRTYEEAALYNDLELQLFTCRGEIWKVYMCIDHDDCIATLSARNLADDRLTKFNASKHWFATEDLLPPASVKQGPLCLSAWQLQKMQQQYLPRRGAGLVTLAVHMQGAGRCEDSEEDSDGESLLIDFDASSS